MPETQDTINPDHKGIEVLVVDDSETIRTILQRYLLKFGFDKVHTASSGEEAVGMYDAMPDRIGLIVSDMQMPGMNGADMLRRIKGSGSKARMLLCSGGEIDIDQNELRREGLGFIQKPFGCDSFLWAVARTLVS